MAFSLQSRAEAFSTGISLQAKEKNVIFQIKLYIIFHSEKKKQHLSHIDKIQTNLMAKSQLE